MDSEFPLFKINADGTNEIKLLDNTQIHRLDIIGNYIYILYSKTGSSGIVSRIPTNGGVLTDVYYGIYIYGNPSFVDGWFVSGNTFYIVEEYLRY